jgi:hypothetical protein
VTSLPSSTESDSCSDDDDQRGDITSVRHTVTTTDPQDAVLAVQPFMDTVHLVTSLPFDLQISLCESFELVAAAVSAQFNVDYTREQDDLKRAQSFIDEIQYKPALDLLRPALGIVPFDSELYPQLETALFEAVQSQADSARAQRKAVLEARLARMQPGTEEYDELTLAIARTEHEEIQFEEEEVEAELSEFQLLSDAMRDSLFVESKVGVSVKWVHEVFLQAQRDLNLIAQRVTPEVVRALRTIPVPRELESIGGVIQQHFAACWLWNDQKVADAIKDFHTSYLASTQAVWDVITATDYRKDSTVNGHGDTTCYAGRLWSATQCADVGRATLFVCHDSSNKFKDLDSALMSLVRQRQLDPSRTFVWMDIFCSPIEMRNGLPKQHPVIPPSAIETINLFLVAMDLTPRVLNNGACRAQMLQAIASQVPLCLLFSTADSTAINKRLVLQGVTDVMREFCTLPAIAANKTAEAARATRDLLVTWPTLEATLDEELLRLMSHHVDAVDMKGLVWLEKLQGQQLSLELGEIEASAPESKDSSKMVFVRGEDGLVQRVRVDELKHTCRPQEDTASDLTTLTYLHDLAVLHNLQRRYFGGGTGHSASDHSFYCTCIGNILVRNIQRHSFLLALIVFE